jgi:hypothetical protein
MRTVTVERLLTYPLPLPELAAQPIPTPRPALSVGHLRWVKPRMFGNRYELRTPDGSLATLTIKGFFRPAGSGDGIAGSWILEPMVRESGTIVVRANDSFQEVGVFEMVFPGRGGILRTTNGQVFVLRANFWKGSAEFQTPSGDPLIRFRYRGLFRPSADVEILGKGKCLRELPWVLMLGWCLIVAYL